MKVLVAVYDRATEAYGAVITEPTRNSALRQFRTEAENQESPIFKHPSDYELWQLAEYDEQNGMITPKPERLARGEDYINGV